MDRLLHGIACSLISFPALAQVDERAAPATNYMVLYMLLAFVALIVVAQVIVRLSKRNRNKEEGKAGRV